MKKMVLLMAALCLAALSMPGISADVQAPKSQMIDSFVGNITQKEIVPVDLLSLFGAPAFFIGETVKFKAPNAGWKINAVQMYGWDGFNGTSGSIPEERIIALEVRDKDLNLLYRFADSQLPYSNYARNATKLYPLTIEIPSVPVSDDFYVSFYDRGAIAVASERLNTTSQNSFLYVEPGNQLIPANLPIGDNETLNVNWIMSVSGN